jgi:hypothetical protein
MNTYLPSWRWVLLWAVIAALVTAVLLLAVERETNEISRHYIDVIIAVAVVAACVCALACQYALLPRKDKRICYLNPDAKAKVHHLAYITDAEAATLMKPEDDGGHAALGKSFPGMFGTQGVPCYPKAGDLIDLTHDDSSDGEGPEGENPPSTQVGWREWVGLPGLGIPWIKAKLDTGARTSSIHALQISVTGEGTGDRVSFWIRPWQESPEDAMFVECPIYDRRHITSSSGHRQERIVVLMDISILGSVVNAEVTLSNRSDMGFRMLIGREALQKGFVVDSRSSCLGGLPPMLVRHLNWGKSAASVQSKTFQVKTLQNETYEIKAAPTDTVAELKRIIVEQESYERKGMQLILKGRVLQDHDKLEGLGYKRSNFMMMVGKRVGEVSV